MLLFVLQDTPGSCPVAWDQEGFPFRQKPSWCIKESHVPFTIHHHMHLPTKTNVPCTYGLSTLVSCPDCFWNETTMNLPICPAHPIGRHIYGTPLIFHVLQSCSNVPKLQIVPMWTIPLPRQHTKICSPLIIISAVVLPK